MVRMVNFFKPAPGSQTRPGARPVRPDSVPLPEVIEGNEESDWALWEDSVAFQDSQMPSGFSELDSVRTRDEPEREEEVDPFATVRRRGA
jgi:hypothetical protein